MTTLVELQQLRGRAGEQSALIRSQMSEVQLAEREAQAQQKQLDDIKRGIVAPLKRARPGSVETLPRYTRQRMNLEQNYLRTEYPKFQGQISTYFGEINQAKKDLVNAQASVDAYVNEIDNAIKELEAYEATKKAASKGGTAVVAASKASRKSYAEIKGDFNSQIEQTLLGLKKQFPDLRFTFAENQIMINDPRVNNNFESIDYYMIQSNKDRSETRKQLENYYGVKISNNKLSNYIDKYNNEIANQQALANRNPFANFNGQFPRPGAFINSLIPFQRVRVTDVPAQSLSAQNRQVVKSNIDKTTGEFKQKNLDPGFTTAPPSLSPDKGFNIKPPPILFPRKVDSKQFQKDIFGEGFVEGYLPTPPPYISPIERFRSSVIGKRFKSTGQQLRNAPLGRAISNYLTPSLVPTDEIIARFEKEGPTTKSSIAKAFERRIGETTSEYFGRLIRSGTYKASGGRIGLPEPVPTSLLQTSFLIPLSNKFKSTITEQGPGEYIGDRVFNIPNNPEAALAEQEAERGREQVGARAKAALEALYRKKLRKDFRQSEINKLQGRNPFAPTKFESFPEFVNRYYRKAFKIKPEKTPAELLKEDADRYFDRYPNAQINPSITGSLIRQSSFQDTTGNYGSIISGSAFGARPSLSGGPKYGINPNFKAYTDDIPAKELPGITVRDYTDGTSPRITRFLTENTNVLAGPKDYPKVEVAKAYNKFTNYIKNYNPFLGSPFSTPVVDEKIRNVLTKTKEFLFADPLTERNARIFANNEALKKGYVSGSGQYEAFVENTANRYKQWVPILRDAFQATLIGVPELPRVVRIPYRKIRDPIYEIEQRPVIFEGIENIQKTVSSYIIRTETKAPQVMFNTRQVGGFLGKAPGDFIIEPPKIKITKTIKPIIDLKAPVFTFTTRTGKTGQVDVLLGKNFPQNLEQLKRLPLNEQYLWKQLATQEVQRILVPSVRRPFQYIYRSPNSEEGLNLLASGKVPKTNEEVGFLFRKQIENLYGKDGLVKLENVPRVLERSKQYESGEIVKSRLANVKRTQDSFLFTTAPPGKRITRFRTASITETKPIIETPEFDLLTGRVYYKDITKPFSRASGKTPRMKGTVKMFKEPVVVKERGITVTYEQPTDVLLQKPANIQKTPFSKTFPQIKTRQQYFSDLSKEVKSEGSVKELKSTPQQTQTVTDYLIPAMPIPQTPRTRAPRLKPPRIAPRPVVASRSAYYGLGMYERTEGGRLPGETVPLAQGVNQFLVSNQMQVPSQIAQQKSEQITKQQQRQIQRQVARQIQIPILSLKQVPRLEQRQIQRQIPRQIQRQIPRQIQPPTTSLIPPRPPTRNPPRFPPSVPLLIRTGKPKRTKETAKARRKRQSARRPTGFGLLTNTRDYSVPTQYLVGIEKFR